MHLASLRNLSGLFAALLVLGCGPASITDDAGADTGSASADDGSNEDDSPADSSSAESSDTGESTDNGDSSTTGSQNTDTTNPLCEPIQLADVALGIGGFALDGEAEGGQSGRAVSGAGDINGDGLDDVIVGAWAATPSGRTYVVFGKVDTHKVQLANVSQGVGGFVLDGEAEWAASGSSVGGAGDVNGDGLADVIVGAPKAEPNGDGSGRTYVVFGKADTDKLQLADVAQGIGGFALDGEAGRDVSGDSISGAGDVNGDGLDDVIVGAWAAHPNGVVFSGRTYVVFGKSDTERVQLADLAQGIGGFVLDGEAEGDDSGFSVDGGGDVNGDGLDDVIVGAWAADPNAVGSSGRTYVVFGKVDTDKVLLADVAQGLGGFALDGEAERDYSGFRVSTAGDVNGDGLADVIVGALAADPNGADSGRTYVVFGKVDTHKVQLANVAQGVGGFVLDGENEEDWSGFSLGGAGDVNGDGLADVIVGAPWAEPNGERLGRTYVVFGKADTEKVQLGDVARGIGGFALDSETEDDYAASFVNGAGDVNDDGLADLIVGAFVVDASGVVDSGRTYVVFGGDFSCAGG